MYEEIELWIAFAAGIFSGVIGVLVMTLIFDGNEDWTIDENEDLTK